MPKKQQRKLRKSKKRKRRSGERLKLLLDLREVMDRQVDLEDQQADMVALKDHLVNILKACLDLQRGTNSITSSISNNNNNSISISRSSSILPYLQVDFHRLTMLSQPLTRGRREDLLPRLLRHRSTRHLRRCTYRL